MQCVVFKDKKLDTDTAVLNEALIIMIIIIINKQRSRRRGRFTALRDVPWSDSGKSTSSHDPAVDYFPLTKQHRVFYS